MNYAINGYWIEPIGSCLLDPPPSPPLGLHLPRPHPPPPLPHLGPYLPPPSTLLGAVSKFWNLKMIQGVVL